MKRIVGADLCVCPGLGRRAQPAGADTQVCPYDFYLFMQLKPAVVALRPKAASMLKLLLQ